MPKTKQVNENPEAGVFVTKGFERKIEHRLTGHISKDFNSVLANYGVGFTGEQMAKAPHTSGGHPHMRAVADMNQVDAL